MDCTVEESVVTRASEVVDLSLFTETTDVLDLPIGDTETDEASDDGSNKLSPEERSRRNLDVVSSINDGNSTSAR